MYSKELLNKAESGNTKAMIELSHAYLKGEGVTQDIEKAMDWIEKAANKGDAAAQHEYAEALHHLGQSADAFYWMKKSAENGHKPAKSPLAVLYLNGMGTDRNIEQGIKWLR